MSIPMELVLKAEAVCDAYEALGVPGKGRDELADLIVGAMLAERKRCAEIVRKWYIDLLDDDRVSDSVARRIESGEQP